MGTLVSDQHTIAEHQIKTADNRHTLYVQQWGNTNGTPILYLHGGPGSGCSQSAKRFFDPARHHVVFIDQRGSGLSAPLGSTEANTTQLLIEDIEQIRAQLKVTTWIVFGSSWGATLALCYALAHKEQVARLVIQGVFLVTEAENEWMHNGALAHFYPETWDKHSSKPDSVLRFAHLTLPTIKLDDRYDEINETEFDESFFTLERHYAQNNWFLPNNHILDHAAELTAPVTIIQGRYDMMTPPKFAYQLHKTLPNSTLQWTVAGHNKADRGNFDAIKAVFTVL